jgi:anti-sigma regulatory factor (Ser/Thr protein kinase)
MGARESDPGKLTCILRGKTAVTDASLAARTFGEAQWLTEDECARLCIIIEELVANLFDHGALTDDHEVSLSLAAEPGGIRIVIVDPGAPFDPREAPTPRERPDRGGGAGIDIVRAWAQVVDYTPVPEGNRLELLLPVGG